VCEAAGIAEVTADKYNVDSDIAGSVIVSETAATGHNFKVISYNHEIEWETENIDGKQGYCVELTYKCANPLCELDEEVVVTYHQLDGEDTETDKFNAIEVAETKGKDCQTDGSAVYTVKNEKDLNGESITKTIKRDDLKGDHKYDAKINFAVDGKTASAYAKCTIKGCNHTEEEACVVTSAANADGSTTYTATSEKFGISDQKTLFDLTGAEITMSTEVVDQDTFNAIAEDADKAKALGLSVKLNGVEISSDLYTVDYSEFAEKIADTKGYKAAVSIAANPETKSTIKASGEATSEDTVLVKKYETFAEPVKKLDGKETDEYYFSFDFDAKGHTFEVSTSTENAVVKYAIVKADTEVTDDDFTLDEATVVDAGQYDVWYRITKADYNTIKDCIRINIGVDSLEVYIDDATTTVGVAPQLNIRVVNITKGIEMSPEEVGIEVYTYGGKALDQLAVGKYTLFVRSSGNYTIGYTNSKSYAAVLTVVEKAEAAKDGWVQENGAWYLYDNGVILKGWQKVNNTWYYLDPTTGVMQTGWLKEGGNWYYLYPSGGMAYEWVKVNGSWYYMGSNGKMATGWVQVKGVWYFLKDNGKMAASEWCNGYWLSFDGAWRYQAKGAWKQNAKGWYFQDTNNWYPKSETVRINGVDRAFDANGYWIEK